MPTHAIAHPKELRHAQISGLAWYNQHSAAMQGSNVIYRRVVPCNPARSNSCQDEIEDILSVEQVMGTVLNGSWQGVRREYTRRATRKDTSCHNGTEQGTINRPMGNKSVREPRCARISDILSGESEPDLSLYI